MKSTGFGVIGAGTWGELHARVYSTTPGARLAAVCDADEGRAREVAEKCGGATVYTDYHQLLADDSVQAVSIVLPDFLHAEAAIAASQAGKHVLVEKPLATTEDDCRKMIAAAKDAERVLFVDFHNRWNPLFTGLKDALDAGEIGEPQFVTYRLNDTIFVPTQMLRWAGRSSVAWFLSSHCLDTLLWLMNARGGGDSIQRLSCITRSRVLQERGIETPDFFHTTLEWKSGLVTVLENCWILPEGGPSVFDLKCQFVGSKGAMFLDGSHHAAAQKQTATSTSFADVLVAPSVHGKPVGFGAESIRHFAASVMSDQKPMTDGIDGLAVTRLILKMEESARENCPVEVGAIFEM